jgi:hypothetical protein
MKLQCKTSGDTNFCSLWGAGELCRPHTYAYRGSGRNNNTKEIGENDRFFTSFFDPRIGHNVIFHLKKDAKHGFEQKCLKYEFNQKNVQGSAIIPLTHGPLASLSQKFKMPNSQKVPKWYKSHTPSDQPKDRKIKEGTGGHNSERYFPIYFIS